MLLVFQAIFNFTLSVPFDYSILRDEYGLNDISVTIVHNIHTTQGHNCIKYIIYCQVSEFFECCCVFYMLGDCIKRVGPECRVF